MRGRLYKLVKKLVLVMMIGTMGLLVVNNSVFTHVHILPDGSMAAHAHPFSKSDASGQEDTHRHSPIDLILLQHLQLLFLWILAALLPLMLSRTAERTLFCFVPQHPALVPVPPGRAPPACM